MPIPFPPAGPQVQAALQKVPTSQLQNYAAGRPPQPTGQVTPGPMGAAAEALNARGAIGAANQRQQAMQNNPANSPTIFQQKDMELQQKAQQLAAMGQQIQQKEQQLGVLGALMAKKAQDMQARESMGVANLPIRPDMFTAMDGGIVFSGGGAVQRFNGVNSSTVKDRPILTNEGLAADFERLLNYFGVPFTSFEEGMARTKEGQEALRRRFERMPELGSMQTASRGEETKGEETKPGESKPRKEDKPNLVPLPGAGVASLTRRDFSADMEKLKPYMTGIDRSDETKLINEYLEYQKKVAAEVAKGNLSEEKAKEMMDARKAEMAAQYSKYTKDRGTRQEELINAMRGEEPTFQERLGAGLKRLPVDLKGVRLGGLFGALGAGAAESDAEYRKRMREAAVKSAEIKELNAKADLLEERGQMAEADKVRKEAEDRTLRRMQTNVAAMEPMGKGIEALLASSRQGQNLQAQMRGQELGAAGNILAQNIAADRAIDLAKFQAAQSERLAALQENYARTRDPAILKELKALADASGIPLDQLTKMRFGVGKTDPTASYIRMAQFMQGLDATSPELQKYLSPDMKQAIKAGGNALKNPKFIEELEKAKERYARDIMSGGVVGAIPTSADILNRNP